MKFFLLDHDGTQHTIDATDGESIMLAIRNAGVDIAAQCGGCCACATCHVYVEADWIDRLPPNSEDEAAMLDIAMERGPLSRLSCQIKASAELDGLRLKLAPGSSL